MTDQTRPADQQEPADAPQSPVRPSRGRRLPGPWSAFILGVCILLLILLHTGVLGGDLERAAVNVTTYFLTLVCLLTLAIWYFFFSGYRRSSRLTLAVAIPGTLIALAVLFRFVGFTGDMLPIFQWRWKAVADLTLDAAAAQAELVDLATTGEDDYPGFLGPERNAYLAGRDLDPDWQANPPELLWRVPIGAGWSSFAIVNGFAVTMEQRGPDELVTCYEVQTGQLRWWHAHQARHATLMGGIGPRGTPTIDEGNVYALGATGLLRCLDGKDGSLIWQDDLLARIGVTPDQELNAIAWGRSASPLIVEDRVIVPLGGPADGPYRSLIAYDKSDGRVLWTGGNRQASYSSPSLATVDGVRQILIVCQDYLGGYSVDDGSLLWEHAWPGSSAANANVSQAVAVGDDRVLVSKAYGGGAELLRVQQGTDGDWQVTSIWKDSRILRTKFSNVVIYQQHVYALSDGILQCVQLDTGQRTWRGGRYAQGQLLGVDDLLLVQAESGDVALVAASPEEFQELARLPALTGNTWNNPALSGKHLLVRNGQEAACYLLP